jgi:hypothetical protein
MLTTFSTAVQLLFSTVLAALSIVLSKINLSYEVPGIFLGFLGHAMTSKSKFQFLFTVFALALSTQSINPVSPQTGCDAELSMKRQKIYVADFYAPYGDIGMGKDIGDYIAKRFETNDHFEVVPRTTITNTMAAFVGNKRTTPNQYLRRTLELAASQGAGCVIFGKILDKKNKISFAARMSSVTTGASALKIDVDVKRTDLKSFLEGIGNTFVNYFITSTPMITSEALERRRHQGFHFNLSLGTGYLQGARPIGSDNVSIESAAGHLGLMIGVAIKPDLILFGAFDGFLGFNPKGRILQSGIPDAISVSDASNNVLTIGVGLKVYGDMNWFLSAALAFASGTMGFRSDTDAVSHSSGQGMAIHLSIGREWWITRSLGVGFSLMGHYSNLLEGIISTNHYYIGLGFSISHN